MRARNFAITVFFPFDEPTQLVEEDFPPWVTFLSWQLEMCETTNKPHHQVYMECSGKKSYAQIQAIPGFDGAHIETRKGTQEQNIAYTTKEDTRLEGPWTYGEAKLQGRRSDLEEMKEKVDKNISLKNLWDENFSSMVRYHRSFKEYKRIRTPVRDERTLIYIICGASGVGKSQLAKEIFPDAYWKPNNKWWDDYDGQESVVWDEFKGQYPYRDLLRILDSTPLTLETKGASCQFTSKIVIFTSNFHPSKWYADDVANCTWDNSPLRRRIEQYGQIVFMGPAPAEIDDSHLYPPPADPPLPAVAPKKKTKRQKIMN